jgi:hypothetical protein
MMNNLTPLITMMQNAIEIEQQPANREKPLTPGLKKAIAIIQEYQAQSNCTYEYQPAPGVWIEVNDNEAIKKLEELGLFIRRKQ